MSLVISLGSNLGNKKANLKYAIHLLKTHFEFISQSRIYTSPAVDYLDQPDFYNQVSQFTNPSMSPKKVLKICQEIENKMGRKRDIPKGPRIIDIDILYCDGYTSSDHFLTIPHPQIMHRSFVVLPLKELPAFAELQKKFHYPTHFPNAAQPLQ